ALLNYGETGGEFFGVWELAKPIVPQARELFKSTQFLGNLERAAQRYETWIERHSPGHIAAMREFMKKTEHIQTSSGNADGCDGVVVDAVHLSAEHLNQHRGSLPGSMSRNFSELANQSLPVHRSQLIECCLSGFSMKTDRHTGWIWTNGDRHWCNNYRLQMTVDLIRGNHQARAGFANLRAMRGIERYQPDLVTLRNYHRHTRWSNSFLPTASKCSSPSEGPAERNFSSQSARSRRSGEIIRHSFSTWRSTLSPKPHCSMTGFGMRIPRELPILISCVLINKSNYIVVTRQSWLQEFGGWRVLEITAKKSTRRIRSWLLSACW